FLFQAEDGIRDFHVTGVQTCALPIYVVALLDAGDAGTDGLDDAGALVPEDGGELVGVRPLAHDLVGVADPGTGDPHADLPGPRRSEERRVGKACAVRGVASPDFSTHR